MYYKSVKLAKGSKALELLQQALKDKNYKPLDAHMKQLDKNEKELYERYKG